MGKSIGCGLEAIKVFVESGGLQDPLMAEISNAFNDEWVVVDETYGCSRDEGDLAPYLRSFEVIPISYPSRFVFTCKSVEHPRLVEVSLPLHIPLELAAPKKRLELLEKMIIEGFYAGVSFSGASRKLVLTTLILAEGDVGQSVRSAILGLLISFGVVKSVLRVISSESGDDEWASKFQLIITGDGMRNLIEVVQKLAERGLDRQGLVKRLVEAGYEPEFAEAAVSAALEGQPAEKAIESFIELLRGEDAAGRLYR